MSFGQSTMFVGKRKPPAHPALVSLPYPKEQSRWLQLVKWLLAVPHLIVLALLVIVAAFATLAAAVMVLATRRVPRPLFDFLLGVYRWYTRVSAYLLLMCDRYPPFSLKEGGYPCDVTLPYVERSTRWAPLYKWLLVVPHLIILEVFDDFVVVVALIAFFGLLFTRRYPEGLFAVNLGFLRWQVRAFAYAGLLTDRYPPYQLEE